MAKTKRRKDPNKKNIGGMIELKGIGLVLMAIIGCCPFGIVAKIIKGFAVFLVGAWWAVLLLMIGAIGIYMIAKREVPRLLNAKYIGLYIMILAVLVLTHTGYIKGIEGINVDKFDFMKDMPKVMDNTTDSIMTFVNNNYDAGSFFDSATGGGLIGAFFASLFTALLTLDGTIVVSIALFICGFILYTGISIYDIFRNTKEGLKKAVRRDNETVRPEKKEKEFKIINNVFDEEQDNEEELEDTRRIVTREELHQQAEEVKEEQKPEDIIITHDDYDPTPSDWKYPPLTLLKKNTKVNSRENNDAIKNNVPIIMQVLRDFGIDAKVVAAHVGPSVTQYELEMKAGTRVNKILGLNREIALALAAKDVRIQAPIPGKSTVGIELPNKVISPVVVREVLASVPESLKDSHLLAVLGKDINGEPKWMEINKTPHLLVAGSTGSGKSVCINSILASLIMRNKPDEVKLVLVDPKKVELSMYNGVPHLLAPVVTDPKKANIALKKIVVEMERRYDVFEASGTKNIISYNEHLKKKNESLPEEEQIKLMPYIVVIIDELADLMLVAAKEVEDSIMRITQMARAAGIHLIVATQRPSTDVITGVVKANIPSRISFAVSSGIDSRTILDMVGAEKLLGKGDMLYLPQGENTPIRIQGTFISEEETHAIVDYVCKQQKARYDETLTMSDEEAHATSGVEEHDATEEPLYNEIVDFVIEQGKASTSLLQRRFRLGYNRAARCIDLLEERGIVGPQNGSKPREVLIKYQDED